MSILREISITCFFSSYLVVLVLDGLRLAGRIPGRALMVVVMMAVGIFTHTTYLGLRMVDRPEDAGLLATWTDCSLLVSLSLAITFLFIYIRRPETIVSFFFLPTLLVLIGFGEWLGDRPPFSRTEAIEIWRSVHAFSMTIATAVVLLGFLAGCMYVVQSWRLKSHRAGSSLKLPTLETLTRWNRQALVAGCLSVGVGVGAGVVMNLNRWGYVGWTDRSVLLSMFLFLWLLGASLIDTLKPQGSSGRRPMYLTIVAAVFLVLALFGVLTGSHGEQDQQVSEVDPPAGTGDITR